MDSNDVFDTVSASYKLKARPDEYISRSLQAALNGENSHPNGKCW